MESGRAKVATGVSQMTKMGSRLSGDNKLYLYSCLGGFGVAAEGPNNYGMINYIMVEALKYEVLII